MGLYALEGLGGRLHNPAQSMLFPLSEHLVDVATISVGEAPEEIERLRISLSTTESVDRSKAPQELIPVRTCRTLYRSLIILHLCVDVFEGGKLLAEKLYLSAKLLRG